MNNARPKPVAEINLEEFERRLRASAAPQAGVEDPLAELTRLVDAIGYERTPSERALEASRPAPKPELRLAAPQVPPPAPQAPPHAPQAPPPAPQPRVEIAPPAVAAAPAPPAPAPPAPPPPLADAEPALRPSFDAEDPDSDAFEPPAPSLEASEPAGEEMRAAARAQSARSRNWGLKVGGLVAAAVVMAGAVVVFKVGGHARLGAPPLILALTTPTKVAPPNEVTIRTANESGALLNRDSAQPTPAAPKLVDPPEAPVDLAARPEALASPMASPAAPSPTASPAAPSPTASAAPPSPAASAVAPSPTASAKTTPETTALDTSPVAPSTDTPIVATAAPAAAPAVSADPSRVKTISVRPDGTLISSGYEAPTPSPAPALSPVPLKSADAGAEASSPPVALPTKLAPPKSAERVVARTETTAPADAGDGPAPVAPKAKKPKPALKPAVVAEAKDDAAPAPSGGAYAVQFAAPRSESEAKALISRFQSRFADAVGGAQFVIHKAERHGQTIYRVRTVGLSKAAAKTMCAKVKAAGGDCYYARD